MAEEHTDKFSAGKQGLGYIYQGRLALYRAGLWPQVQAFVAGITDPTEAFEADAALNHTVDWERSSPFLCRAAQALGLDDATLDELFRTAAQIVP